MPNKAVSLEFLICFISNFVVQFAFYSKDKEDYIYLACHHTNYLYLRNKATYTLLTLMGVLSPALNSAVRGQIQAGTVL